MTTPKLVITRVLEALPGKQDEVRRKLDAVTDGMRRVGPDLGMIRADLYRQDASPSRFLLCETWTTQRGFADARPPELSALLKEADGLLAETPEIVSHHWHPVSPPAGNRAAVTATAFLDALAVSDADAIAGMWTDDAVLEFPFAPQGFPRSVDGQPAIEKYFRDALAVVTPIAYPDRVVTPLADPDACVIEFGSRLTVGDDPTVQENSYITIVRVRGGKIVHFKEHYDSVKRVAGFPSADEVAGEAAPAHTVTVNLRARADAADTLAQLMREVGHRAEKDAGCRFYRVFRSHADPSAFTVFEAWDAESDFNAHLAADWVAEINAKIAPLLDAGITSQSHSEL